MDKGAKCELAFCEANAEKNGRKGTAEFFSRCLSKPRRAHSFYTFEIGTRARSSVIEKVNKTKPPPNIEQAGGLLCLGCAFFINNN